MLQVNRAFDSPFFIVVDSLRLVCVALGAVTMAMMLRVAMNPFSRPYLRATPWGATACGLLVASATFTELGRIGHTLTWRLPLNLVGEACALAYCYRLNRIHVDLPADQMRTGWPFERPEDRE